MRKDRSPRARKIASILAALLVIGLGLVRWKGAPSVPGSPIRRVDPVDPPAPARSPESAPEVEHRVPPSASRARAPSPSGMPSVAGGAATPVFDLATLAHPAPEPGPEGDRFRTDERFTADDLAHPERYFEAAEHLPELRRDEEQHDALEFCLAYRARLERDLGVAGADPNRRAAVLAVIERYDAAIARLQSSPATPAP